MRIKQFVVSSCATNCYVVINEETNKCFVVDPGASAAQIYKFICDEKLVCEGILLTHGHFDHAGAAEELQKLCKESQNDFAIYAYHLEEESLINPLINLSGAFGGKETSYKADTFLKDRQEFDLAGYHIICLHTPGHTPGGCCYYIPMEDLVFSGDTLFAESIGRTDFFSGSMRDIVSSIKEKLLTLPERTVVLSGHGDSTTIEHEMMYNPYL